MNPNYTRKDLIDELDAMLKKYNLSFDDFLDELSKEMKEQASKESHETVKNLLNSVAELLSEASFDFYASCK